MLLFNVAADSVLGQCQAEQRALLLQLRTSLSFTLSRSTKLKTWSHNNHRDCCLWLGVTCDSNGHVTALDLAGESIEDDNFNNSSPLFHLHHLQSLDLSHNYFYGSQIPTNIGILTNLVHLSLSNSEFGGQIPSQVSNLTRLTTLDLSVDDGVIHILKLDSPSLSSLVQNLTQLQELYLDGVSVYDTGKAWCQALSSSLPNLRVLSMSYSDLTGPIDFLGNIFQLLTLETLDLSNNMELEGFLTEFPKNGSLKNLNLDSTKLSGRLPESIGNLERLSSINLANCNLDGEIPRSIEKLRNLVRVDLSFNRFNGTIPSFAASKRLNELILTNNAFAGNLPDNWDTFQNLLMLDVSGNALTGRIPPSLFSNPLLENLQLSNNRFSGELTIPSLNRNMSNLRYLGLSGNHLNGSLPISLTRLYGLSFLSIASNNMSGYLHLGWFNVLTDLAGLDLSYNNFSIPEIGKLSLPQLKELKLTSCGLTSFPDMRELSTLKFLDLSDNQITGQVPRWIWDVGNNSGSQLRLNLSHNQLTDFEEDYVAPSIDVLDIHSNMFRRHIPLLPSRASYIDYSNNYFTSSIPLGDDKLFRTPFISYLSLSNNSLIGTIPEHFCDATKLQVLDLSDNELRGSVPECLFQMNLLGAVNLGGNNLSGVIADAFPYPCALQTLDLSRNQIGGKIPRSLANCSNLEILNIGSNRIRDLFPLHLNTISSLQVLVLRSNRLYGSINCKDHRSEWPVLKIIDLAINDFDGELEHDCLVAWKTAMSDSSSTAAYLAYSYSETERNIYYENKFKYYQTSVSLVFKGHEWELSKILSIYTGIDLSSNNFKGPIPDAIGEFKELHFLNLSNNAFTGPIPSVIGNLRQLESLDLSSNNLTREIPKELTNLNFLSYLNLSDNQLVGEIPSGAQLQSFSPASFEGNKGLCGLPLKNMCGTIAEPPSPIQQHINSDSKDDTIWIFSSAAIGFICGFWIFIGPLVLWERWRRCYNFHVDRLLFWLFPRLEQRNRGRQARRHHHHVN